MSMYNRKFIIFFLQLIITLKVYGQLLPDFTTQDGKFSGCGSMSVSFIDQTQGNPTQWYWDFGNNTTSTLQNPQVTFTKPGKYKVKLTVRGSTGNPVDVEKEIIVYKKPSPNFSAGNLTSTCSPLVVNFTDFSSPGDAPIKSYFWNFGDGTSSTLKDPSHTYNIVGLKNVTLKVVDENNCEDTKFVPNLIDVGRNQPTANFSSEEGTSSCVLPFTVKFTNNSTGNGNISYLWDFGDNSPTLQEIAPRHTYTTGGNFKVRLVATSEAGCIDVQEKVNFVQINTNVSVNIGALKTTVCSGEVVEFEDNSTPTPVTWLWDFGDGNSSSERNPKHTYTKPGTYNVTLRANFFGDCNNVQNTIPLQITVNPTPNVDFTATVTDHCQLPFTPNFINNTTNATQYRWNFGDNTPDQTTSVHTYNREGKFDVKLVAINNFGCKDSIIKKEYIKIEQPSLKVKVAPASGCIPLNVTFSDASTFASGSIVDWDWIFSDGGEANDIKNPQHTFNTAGWYDVTLRVTTDKGCTRTKTFSKIVKASSPPVASFDETPVTICAGMPLGLFDKSRNADVWLWEFGDGGKSSDTNPVHKYSGPGEYDVKLTVKALGCGEDSKIVSKKVKVLGSVSNFALTTTCSSREISIEDLSIDADEVTYSFPNTNIPPRTVNMGDVFFQELPSDGYYVVRLLTKNNTTGCTDEMAKPVKIATQLKADFDVTPSMFCAPGNVTIFNKSTSLLSGLKSFWDFNDGSEQVDKNLPLFNYSYPKAKEDGTPYAIKLTVEDESGCKKEAIKYVTVTNAIMPDFSYKVTGCGPYSVKFTNLSGSGLNYRWTFQPGQTSTEEHPTYTQFNTPGTYPVTLKVSAGTCEKEITKNIVISNITNADFTPNKTVACVNSEVSFTPSPNISIYKYEWNFGANGAVSTDRIGKTKYAAKGTYNVSVKITDDKGCVVTSPSKAITVDKPTASSTTPVPPNTCAPVFVNFSSNSSADVTKHFWDFGDGKYSTEVNPQNVYLPGTYKPKLVVENIHGCKDTLKMNDLVINGPVLKEFKISKRTVCPGEAINFEIISENTTSSSIDFADGSPFSNLSKVTHSYSTEGNKSVIVKLKQGTCEVTYPNETAGQDPDMYKITVRKYQITADTDKNICEGESITLNATADDAACGFQWTPNLDISNPNIPNPIVSPTTTRTYTVQDPTGCSNTASVTVNVNPKPIPDFTYNKACVGEEVTFTNKSTGNIVSYEWDFGDNSPKETTQDAKHIFSKNQTYNVSLKAVNDKNCSNSKTIAITPNFKPIANFTVNASCVNTPITFTNTSNLNGSKLKSILWHFSSTASSTATTPQHTYTTSGVVQPELIVETTEGCKDTVKKEIIIHSPPTVDFFANQTEYCPGKNITILDQSNYINNITLWEWQVNGRKINQKDITNLTINQSGKYDVTHRIVDDKGCDVNTSKPNYLTIHPKPTAGFTVSEKEKSIFDPIFYFSDNSSTDVKHWLFNFGDGLIKDLNTKPTKLEHIYANYGEYDVTLFVTNTYNCEASFSDKIKVLSEYRIATPNAFTPNGDGINDIFKPKVIGISEYRMTIYDRIGQVVFETNNLEEGWNGKKHNTGEELQVDVYAYKIEAKDVEGNFKVHTGKLNLIR